MALALASPNVPALARLVDRANDYATVDARSPSTRRAYFSDFRVFEHWCTEQGLPALPASPETVAVYLAAMADAGKRPSTLERALAGIVYVHRANGFEWRRGQHPAVAAVMSGIRRKLGTAPSQKMPLADQELAALLATMPPTLTGLRDRALLTLGWFGAFRRAELTALGVEDVQKTYEGLVITVRRSKSDQEGRGALKGIPYASNPALCPVRALARWLEASGIQEGPLFRFVDRNGHIRKRALSDRSVALIVQRAAERAGLDPKSVAGHSLRSGFVTTAARRGKSLDAIMRQTLHKCERVARTYIRHAKVFDDNAAFGIA